MRSIPTVLCLKNLTSLKFAWQKGLTWVAFSRILTMTIPSVSCLNKSHQPGIGGDLEDIIPVAKGTPFLSSDNLASL